MPVLVILMALRAAGPGQGGAGLAIATLFCLLRGSAISACLLAASRARRERRLSFAEAVLVALALLPAAGLVALIAWELAT